MLKFLNKLFGSNECPYISLRERRPLLGEMAILVTITPEYITDPLIGWRDADGKFYNWPHPFPPTHWVEFDSPYAWKYHILKKEV